VDVYSVDIIAEILDAVLCPGVPRLAIAYLSLVLRLAAFADRIPLEVLGYYLFFNYWVSCCGHLLCMI